MNVKLASRPQPPVTLEKPPPQETCQPRCLRDCQQRCASNDAPCFTGWGIDNFSLEVVFFLKNLCFSQALNDRIVPAEVTNKNLAEQNNGLFGTEGIEKN